MTCARRPVGAHRSASSTSAGCPRRPDPRRGLIRARLFRLLPVLALLLGALCLPGGAFAQGLPPFEPVDTHALAGPFNLKVTWKRNPSGAAPTSYRVHYTASATVAWNAVAGSNTDPATGWVDTGYRGHATEYWISILQPGTRYRVRVYARNSNGQSGEASTARATATTLPSARGYITRGIWSSTLTVDNDQGVLGCDGFTSTQDNCSVALTDNDVWHRGKAYTVKLLYFDSGNSQLAIGFDGPAPPYRLDLLIGNRRFPGHNASSMVVDGNGSWTWSGVNLSWTDNQKVEVALDIPSAPLAAPQLTRLSLIAGDNAVTLQHGDIADPGSGFDADTYSYRATVPHGTSSVEVKPYWTAPFAGATVTSKPYRDQGTTLAGPVSVQSNGAVEVPLASDVTRVEVVLHRGEMRTDRTPQYQTMYTITIAKKDEPLAASLSVDPARVDEGDSTTVTVTLSAPFTGDNPARPGAATRNELIIPLTRPDLVQSSSSAEFSDASFDGNHLVRIPIGAQSGTKVIRTHLDDDTDDDTFTVALGTLPAGVAAGTPSSVEITIVDDQGYRGGGTPDGTEREPLTASFERVPEGHDGASVFKFDIRFSAVLGSRGRLPKKASFTVEGGKVNKVRYVERGLWRVRVKPASAGAVTVRLEGGRDCDEKGAVCTIYGQALVNSPSLTVAGPGGVSPMARCAAHLPANAVSVAEVTGWRDAHAHDASHVLRWNRVLAALGEDTGAAPLTVAGSKANERRYMKNRWSRVTGTLQALRTCLADGRQQAPPAVTPEVSIAAGAGVTEGSNATFTLTANPAPASALTVEVAVTQSGGYAAAGTHRVTIPASGTATLAVATQDDAVDEPDGSVSAALAAGAGYTVSSAKAAATVAVADDDVPEVSIAAGADVTEGVDATFTLTANPTPASALTVEVAVTQSGGYAPAGTRQVTIPPAGTATLAVATVDDSTDEPDGSVSAALAAGAGYTVSSAKAAATVAVADNDAPAVARAFIRTRQGYAREADAAIVFRVVLTPAVPRTVTVDYASADGDGPWNGIAPASAGADYTHVEGTLTFAPGETAKAVRVPLLDDAIDEGAEHVLMRFSNPQGASLDSAYREMVGYIVNDDPLQAMWLARFGRMVASDAVASVTARFETPRDAGSHVTLAGQRVDFGEAEGGGGKALATVLTGFARTFGAPAAPAADKDDPFLRHGLTSGWNDPAAATGARSVTARELLMGTSFRAVLGQGAGSQWTSWGQGASVSQFSAGVPGLALSGESATGSMGMDYERGRLLMGFAMTHSVGEGTASDERWRYALGSTATMALPYARLALSDRLSVWGMAGTGSGTLSLDLDGSVAQRYRTDLEMTMAATGVRGELVTPAEAGGFALALKADAFWVRTESDRVTASAFGSLMDARGESSRVRAVLDGSRTFAFASGAALTPKLELGVRHDAGDAETGTGLEFGAGLGWADPSRGLDMALKVHGLAVHAQDGYDEWGVSGQLRLVPGGTGRGLSASLTPSYGVDPSGSERLWALPASSGLAAGGNAVPSSRLDAEVGYGMALWGDRFTGTPNVGFGLSDTAREYRMGWRLTSAVRGDPGFEVSLDATRREAVNHNGPAEHGVMLRSMIRW